jgi:pilus assembly protein Flp/PilA
VKRFLRDDSGATAIEYSLIATFMAIALIAAVPVLSSGVTDLLADLALKLDVFP